MYNEASLRGVSIIDAVSLGKELGMCEAKKILAAAKKERQRVLPKDVEVRMKEIQTDPAKALDFLVKAGIADRSKRLTKHYR
jgi:hypothetical protein